MGRSESSEFRLPALGSDTHLIGTASLFPESCGRNQSGYAMAGLLVALGIMSIIMSAALPVWSQAAKREREAELVFRGEQYARAVELYQRQFVGAYPPDIETLVERKFLRKAYTDPMMEDDDFRIVYLSQAEGLQGEAARASRPGETTSDEADARLSPDPIRFDDGEEGGVVGVVSRSDEESLRIYNGREKYSEWAFIYVPTAAEGAGGVAAGSGTQPSRRGPGGTAAGDERGRFDLGNRDGRSSGSGLPPPRGGSRSRGDDQR